MDTLNTQCQNSLNSSPQEPFAAFYTAHISEEKGGRPLPGLPTKIMGSDPMIVGRQVAKLIKHRYRELIPETLSKMPRTKLITVELKSSYLSLRLEPPQPNVHCKNRVKAFGRFSSGLQAELLASKAEDKFIRRRRPN